MNTCKTCKWWDKEPFYSQDCPMRECKHPKFGTDSRLSDGLAQAGMDAGYVNILTGPDFGCVHHELAVSQIP